MPAGPSTSLISIGDLRSVLAGQRGAWFRAQGGELRDLDRLADEAERLCFSDVRAALEATEAIVALADELAQRRGRAMRSRAQALAYAGRHDEALATGLRAAELSAIEGDAVESARARLITLHPLNELGRHDEAIAIGTAARDELISLGEFRLAARADFNLGGIHQNRDDPIAALRHFDRAATAFADDPLITGYLQNNRGEALLLLNEFDAAEQAFEGGLAACEKAGADVAAAIAEGNLADLCARRGNLSRALSLFENARRRFEKNNATSHLVRLQAEQAEAIGALGLESDALAAYEELLPRLVAMGLVSEVNRARLAIGRLLLQLDRSAEAEAVLREAGEELTRSEQRRDRAVAQVLLAEIALRNGDYARATELIESAAPHMADRPIDRARLAYLRGSLLERQDAWKSACEQFDIALRTIAPLDISPVLADLFLARADALFRSGERGSAVDDFRRAVAEIEKSRNTLQADRMRSAYLGNRLSAYEGLVQVLLESGVATAQTELFETIERAKCRSLADSVRGIVVSVGGDQPPSPFDEPLRREHARAAAELNALYCRLADATHSGRDIPDWDGWAAALRQRQQSLTALETRMQSTARERVTESAMSFAGVQQQVMRDVAIVEYFCARGEWIALVVRNGALHVCRDLARGEDLSALVEQTRFQIARAARPGATEGLRGGRLLEETRAALHDTYRRLWQPISQSLHGASRIVVVPHGPLHALPMHALWNGKSYLVEDASFAYSPSASIYAQLARAGSSAPLGADALVVGVSDAAAPRIADEAAEVAAALGASPLIDAAATSEAVCARLAKCELAHLACHATFARTNAAASGLRLSDRWLTVRELSQLKLRARLVTLSGCSTGRTASSRGDELDGLMHPFLSGGVETLVASLWAAGDRSTYYQMVELYRSIAGSSRTSFAVADALSAIQRRALSTNPHPFWWAPFIVVGRP